MTDWKVENWLDDTQLSQIEYSAYWNDEEKEKEKEWYVLDAGFTKFEEFLNKTNLPDDLKICIEVLKADYKRQLEWVGIDLAAGNLWAVPFLFKLGKIDKLYCLDISKHRLFKNGLAVLDHYSVPGDKVVLVYGSFYNLRFEDESIDFAFLSTAFHHAERPIDLLKEIKRVLKPNGICIIIGEPIISYYVGFFKNLIKMFALLFLSNNVSKRFFKKTEYVKKLIPSIRELYPSDNVTGDHFYTSKEYYSMFGSVNFKVRRLPNPKMRSQSFILLKGY